MSFIWSPLLLCLLLVPLFGALYAWAQTRRRRYRLRYSDAGLVSLATAARRDLRRHLPAGLYLLALAALGLSAARPQATVPNPEATGTVILTIDASRSMLSADIAPSRIDAAKAAVRGFVAKQPKGIRIGVVAFAGSAALVLPPTHDRRQVAAAVNSLSLGNGTNIGHGLQVSLEAIFPDLSGDGESFPGARQQVAPRPATGPEAALIVLLSDGASTTGPPAVEVARQLAEAGIRTYTVGLGTPEGGGPGGRFARRLDEPTLRAIAEETEGKYFSAEDASQLHEVYGKIARQHELVQRRMEVTALTAGAAMLLLLSAAVLGSLWGSRLP